MVKRKLTFFLSKNEQNDEIKAQFDDFLVQKSLYHKEGEILYFPIIQK